MKKIIPVRIAILWAILSSSGIHSLSITVEATNKTLNQKATYAEKISIIQLAETMKTVETKTDTVLPHTFRDLPEMENAPYMVQVTWQGVNYNKVIPPNTQGNDIPVNIDIYNTTSQFAGNLSLEKFIEVHYFSGVLATDITQHVTNASKFTFTERGSQKGILMYVPENGSNLEAITTLESLHGSSNIKTVKLNPVPLPDKPGYYILDQPAKPGEKYYQTRILYKYTGESLEVTFDNIYPMSAKPMVILHPKEMKVIWKENPSWDTKPVFNENIGTDYITLPNQQGKFTLIFSGGIPEKAEMDTASANTQIEVQSPVDKYRKIGGMAVFVICCFAIFLYIKNQPSWLLLLQAKNKSRLQFELENLKTLNLPPELKSRKEAKIKAKLESLNKNNKVS